MDPITIAGVVLAFGAIVGSMIMEGGDPMAIVLIPPMILVFGGTIGAAIAGGVLADAKEMPKLLVKAFTAKLTPADQSVEVLVSLAGKARKEGLLALENELSSIDDDFLRRALQMAVDGTDSAAVSEILGAEVDAKRAADKQGAKMFHDMGGFAPTIGIIGTVIGLVHVLGNLENPETLGHSIASAFVATLWGVLTANVLWFPLANRLKRVSDKECAQMEMAIEGVLAIQEGSNPRIVQQKLESMIPPADQKKEVA